MEAVVFVFSLLDCCALIFLSVYFVSFPAAGGGFPGAVVRGSRMRVVQGGHRTGLPAADSGFLWALAWLGRRAGLPDRACSPACPICPGPSSVTRPSWLPAGPRRSSELGCLLERPGPGQRAHRSGTPTPQPVLLQVRGDSGLPLWPQPSLGSPGSSLALGQAEAFLPFVFGGHHPCCPPLCSPAPQAV